MKNPNPVNLQTSAEIRDRGWQAESRDADGHLISCHAPIEADDPGIAEWIVECTSRGETVTFWPTNGEVAATQPPPPSSHVEAAQPVAYRWRWTDSEAWVLTRDKPDHVARVVEPLFTAPPPQTHVTVDEARRKLSLWFFRDLSGEQRGKLFALFGLNDVQKDTSHGYQAMGLAHVVRLLATTEGQS